MQVLYFLSRQNSETFDVLHAFLPLTVQIYQLSKAVGYLVDPV